MLRLCLVTPIRFEFNNAYQLFLRQAIRGGITSVQLRDKNPNQDLFEKARQMKRFLDQHEIPLIINDHVELARQIDAAGVHIGQTDISPFEARRILGPKKTIGLSIESIPQLNAANKLSCIDS